jgi:hypothetical protein
MCHYVLVTVDDGDQPLQDAATLPPMPGGYSVLHVGQLVDGNVRHVAALLNLLLGFPVGDPHRVRYVLRRFRKWTGAFAHLRSGYLVVPTVAAPAVLARTRTFWITPSGTAAVSQERVPEGSVWPTDILPVLAPCPLHPVTVVGDVKNVEQVLSKQRMLLPAKNPVHLHHRPQHKLAVRKHLQFLLRPGHTTHTTSRPCDH